MAKILLIETSTAECSVALEKDGTIVASRVSGEGRTHASLTAVYCKEVLEEAGITPAGLDAVCISDGPGSYTGLRVGLSTAKGLCFGSGAKLLSVSSLDVLAEMALEKGFAGKEPSEWQPAFIVPMIDARRMEVYTARYDASGKRISPIEALVIDESSFADTAGETLFIGDGAMKCKGTVKGGRFVDTCPLATSMARIAEKEYAAGNFRDVAYFEPDYVKEFVATVSKKKLF